MARPKTPTKDKVIRWLNENPDTQITYRDLARKTGSHAIAVGQIMKSLGRDPNLKGMTKLVVHTPKKSND